MSHTFKDAALPPREWTLDVTVATARAVRDQAGVNIYSLPQEKFKGLFELLSDPFKLIEMAFVLCAKQAKERSVDLAGFEGAIDGPALESLGDAIVEAIPDFFSDTAMRANLKSVFAKSKKVTERLMAKGTAQVAAFDPETVDLDQLLSQIQARQSSSDSSGNGPASSASIPDPSPSPISD